MRVKIKVMDMSNLWCNCNLPCLGVIDGDLRAVRCGKCEKILGCADTAILEPGKIKLERTAE